MPAENGLSRTKINLFFHIYLFFGNSRFRSWVSFLYYSSQKQRFWGIGFNSIEIDSSIIRMLVIEEDVGIWRMVLNRWRWISMRLLIWSICQNCILPRKIVINIVNKKYKNYKNKTTPKMKNKNRNNMENKMRKIMQE